MESIIKTYSCRLKPGQDLKQEIALLVNANQIEAGVILTCVGSLTDVTIRLANQQTASQWWGHFEIVSLVGTLSIHGNHVHISVADSTGVTFGGHLLEGCLIYTTAELIIGVMKDLVFKREYDELSGYNELTIQNKTSL